MDQEQTPRFSHIAVGSPEPNTEEQPEEEEVIHIGSVIPVPASVSGIPAISPAPLSESVVASPESSEPEQPVRAVRQERDDDGLSVPMSLTQKIVLIACLIGLIIAGVFIVNYWLAS